MPRKSTKDDKSIYQLSRESAGLTREGAAEAIGFLSADRLYLIESGKTAPHGEEVMAMAEAYGDVGLCNRYCARECPIGQKTVPEAEEKSLSQLTVEILYSLQTIAREKERLIEITADGMVSEEEMPDFVAIGDELDRLSLTVDSLKLWLADARKKRDKNNA